MLRSAALLGIGAVAVMRCTVVIQPALEFVTDPLLDPSPIAGIGPVGSLVLDVVLLLACAAGLLSERFEGRGIDWKLFALALIPMPVLIWHGSRSFFDAWTGSTWLSAMIAAVTVAHLARDRSSRWVLIAILSSIAVPLVMRGLLQVYVEHPRDMRFFEEHRVQVLLAQGIDPNSRNAEIYERRLRQAEATGWFGLANVFGSVMVAGLTIWAGVMVTALRARMMSGWWGSAAIIVAACALGLWYAGSNGAFAAALLGLILLLAGATARGRSILRRAGGCIAIAAVAAALLGVVARGVLPESFAGDKSILFRWYYMTTSLEVIAENPIRGVGPDGFQEAYIAHRHPRSPEEVKSAHSIFFDWLAMMGLSGAAWIALAGVFIWRSGIALAEPMHAEPARGSPGRAAYITCALAMLAGLTAAMVAELPVLDGGTIVSRAMVIIAAVACAPLLLHIALLSGARLLEWSIAAGAVALMAHAQIEITLVHAGAVVWGLCLVGASGHRSQTGSRGAAVIAAAICCAVAIGLMMFLILPAARQQAAISSAAAPLKQLSEERERAIADPALLAAFIEREIDARRTAGAQLVGAYEIMTTNAHPLRAGIEQYLIAALSGGRARVEYLEDAALLTERLLDDHPTTSARAQAAFVYQNLAPRTGLPEHWNRALELREAVAAADPCGVSAHVMLADLLWEMHRRDDARDMYRRALELNANWDLDPLKQLSEGHIERIQSRLAE